MCRKSCDIAEEAGIEIPSLVISKERIILVIMWYSDFSLIDWRATLSSILRGDNVSAMSAHFSDG